MNFISEQIALRVYLLFLVTVIVLFGMIAPATTFRSLVSTMRDVSDKLG